MQACVWNQSGMILERGFEFNIAWEMPVSRIRKHVSTLCQNKCSSKTLHIAPSEKNSIK